MITGSIVALVTPFKNNEIDYNSVEKLLSFHLENQTDGVLFCGTTGESPSLAGDEKERLIRFGIKKISGMIPVIVGTGTNNLHHTISATIKAQDWGADYALVITPYYNKPTQNGLYLYFRKILESTDIPIIIYNVPGRTGINITAETTIRLATEFDNIVGIKEASGNLVQASEITKKAPKDFSLLSGEDALNLPLMSCGAKGAISVTANVVPKKVHDLIEYCLKGNYEDALKIHRELIDLNQMMFIETNPIPVKHSLSLLGMIENELRLPLCFLKEENRLKMSDCLKKYDLI